MAKTDSAKGNPASTRMMNVNYRNKRIRNKTKNDRLKALGMHPKQLRQKAETERAIQNAVVGHNHRKKFTLWEADAIFLRYGRVVPDRRIDFATSR